jgi:ComF family protein
VDKSHYKNLIGFLGELLFPSFCRGCQREGSLLCYDCQHLLEISEYNYCLCSKNPLRLPPESNKGTCPRCQDRKLSGLYAALPYSEKALTKRIIYHAKEKPYLKNLIPVLSEVIAQHLVIAGNNAENIWANSVLVPVPLSNNKLRERGYNQSEELAKALSRFINVPTVTNVLVKTVATQPQKNLSADQRQKNVATAFAIKNPSLIASKKVYLIDDVYTTGSTMEACADVLRTFDRTKKIWGIVFAREVLH